jgi:hypothetical protein
MLNCTKPQEAFIVPINGERVAFTPDKYDAKTGRLYGYDHRGNSVSISVGRSLTPCQPIELEWDDD